MAAHDRPAGRPRDTSIDEIGWDELSMRLVAARAGVGRSSLNRRWSSKAELVLHACIEISIRQSNS